jgi:hypothetical protein
VEDEMKNALNLGQKILKGRYHLEILGVYVSILQ